MEASGYATSTRNVSATRSYPNLSEADVSLVPKSIEDSGRTLTLADVQWQEAGGFYNAAATYTGTASSKYATGYTVTADYAGEVTKTTSGTVLYISPSTAPSESRSIPIFSMRPTTARRRSPRPTASTQCALFLDNLRRNAQ